MDVNGTRLHLLLGRDDWQRSIVAPMDPDVCYDERRETIGLRPRPFVFPTRTDAKRLVPEDRRGADIDRFGNRFWIGADRRSIRAVGATSANPFTWWPAAVDEDGTAPAALFAECEPAETSLTELAGAVITTDQYLVVGTLGRTGESGESTGAGLLVFDLAGGGPPVSLHWPGPIGVRPVDMARRPNGGIVVLDAPTTGPPRLWYLDQHFQLSDLGSGTTAAGESSPFAPADASAPRSPTPVRNTRDLGLATESCAVVLDLLAPVSVDALPDDTVLVLEPTGVTGHPEVSRWSCGVPVPFALRLAPGEPETEFSFVCTDQHSNAHDVLAGTVGHDIVLVPPAVGSDALARLFMVDDRGDQAFEFNVHDDGAELVPNYHPLRLFSGKALLSDGSAAYYDLGDRWYPIPTRPVDRFASDAVVMLAPDLPGGRGFDAGAPRTVWHRLVFDAVIPAGCAIGVETRTADDLTVLEHQTWRHEPSPYLRGNGSEIPYHRYPDGTPSTGQGSWELLFQRAVGRFLQLRLTLSGDGRRTPRIWAVRVHFPRFSYLEQYLPAIFREDRESASFLDRYLANVEGMYTTLEGQITNVQRLVDPSTLDAEFLPWLASWIGATVEPDWDDARTRLFVRHAAQMFTRRGTSRGMIEAIRLATHPCPGDEIFESATAVDAFDVRIVEAFRTRSVPGVVFGDPNDLAGPRLSPSTPRWTLDDGGSQLLARWRRFHAARHGTGARTTFPVLTPADTMPAADWHDFVRGELDVTYADVGSGEDLAVYRSFLEQRYRRIDDYRSAWNLTGAGPSNFETVTFPGALPADGAPLQDWIMFVSSVLPTRSAAHRATVLVPIRLEDSDEERLQRLGRVQRVVEVERPAHTLVDVRPYWAALRVGEARVGFETIVGEGGRYVDLVLGSGRLAHAATPGGRTWRLDDRVVVGRDRIERSAIEPAGTGGL